MSFTTCSLPLVKNLRFSMTQNGTSPKESSGSTVTSTNTYMLSPGCKGTSRTGWAVLVTGAPLTFTLNWLTRPDSNSISSISKVPSWSLYTLTGKVMLPTVVKTVSKNRVSVEKRSACSGLESHTSLWQLLSDTPKAVQSSTNPVRKTFCGGQARRMVQRCSTCIDDGTNGPRVSCPCAKA